MAKDQPVALVVGASRGIGRQVAIDLARNGYAVIVAAKTTSDASKCNPFPPDPNSSASTINTVAREITDAGFTAVPIAVDVRSDESVQALVSRAATAFPRADGSGGGGGSGLDVVVYNPGAIWWASVANTPVKRFRLMQEVNVQGLYSVVQAVLPVFAANACEQQSEQRRGRGRLVVISPPIYSRFLRGKTAYAMTKWGMSALTMGLAVDFAREGKREMAITSLWPAAAIESAATQFNRRSDENEAARRQLRHPAIFSDAILAIVRAPAADVSGKCVLDEDFLREHEGVTDFSRYALVPGASPRRIMPAAFPDLSVREQDDEGTRMDSTQLRKPKL